MIIQTVWIIHNMKIWQDQVASPKTDVSNALHFICLWQTARIMFHNICSARESDRAKIQTLPRQGRVKCNIDVSIFPFSNQASYRAFIMDETRGFMAESASTQLCQQDPSLDEAICYCEALLWIKVRRLVTVSVELDKEDGVHFLFYLLLQEYKNRELCSSYLHQWIG